MSTLKGLAALDISFNDLHDGNVLKDSDGHLRIIDLGVSVTPEAVVPGLERAFGRFGGLR